MTDSGSHNAWPRAKLGDICSIVIGRTPRRAEPRYWGGTHTWATISDMTASDGVVYQTRESLSDDGAALCGDRLLPAGTLMFSFKLSIGQITFAGCDLYTNEAIAGIIPHGDQEVDLRYLRRALSVADYDELIGHAAKGRTLNRKTLALLEIPLPPLDEQRRIVARLEGQMAATERARAAAQAQLAAIEAMPQALLREIFPRSPAARLTRGWRWAKLGDVCKMGSGGTPTRGHAPYFGGSIPWVIIGDLNDDVVIETQQTITELGLANSSAKLVPPGAVLIAMYGSIGKLGIAGVELTTNQAIAHIVPDPDLDPQWLLAYLRADRARLATAGSGITQSNISQTVLKRWDVPVPPIDEQRRIISALEEQHAAIDRARAAAQAQLDAIDALPAAALRLAFAP